LLERENVHLSGIITDTSLKKTLNALNQYIMSSVFLFLSSIGAPEIIIVALIVLLLFGGKKIPELMKGLGKGVRSFKAGMKDIDDEINKDPDTDKKE